MASLVSLEKLPELVDLGPLNIVFEQLFGPVMAYVDMADFFESEEDGVRSVSLVLGIKQTMLLPIPGFSDIQLGVVSDNPDEWPIVLFELVVEGAPPKITIKHFPLRVMIENPYLTPIGEDSAGELLPGFSFELEGGFSLSADGNVAVEMESFSVPPFLIEGLNMILGLDECQLITAADDVDQDLIDLGFDDEFRGIQAQSAQFYWDIPFLAEGAEFPGLRLTLDNLAIGNQGVSVSAQLQWDVSIENNQIDPAQTDIHGELFDSGWHFALGSLAVVLERNIPTATSGSGMLYIPMFAQWVKVELGYEYKSPDQYQLAVDLRQHTDQGLTLSLGSQGQQLQIRHFQFSGQVNSEGEFSLSGNAQIDLDFPGIAISTQEAEVSFEHNLQQENLLIKLSDVQVDQLGQVDLAQLVIVLLNDGQGNHELALLEIITEFQWQDLSSRIALDNDFPLLPLPPDDASVSMNLSWNNDVLNFSVKAELEDVDSLWRFVPETARPEVGEANLDIQLTTDGSDFSGEFGVEFLLRLPDLEEIGAFRDSGLADFISIDSGDEDGWIELRFAAQIDHSDSDSAGSLSASMNNPITIELQLPGLLMPEPPIVIEIEQLGLTLNNTGDAPSGEMTLAGAFALYPILPDVLADYAPPQIAMYLDSLLSIARQVDLSGNANLLLGISEDNVYFRAECEFEQAALELDIFDMLAAALTGAPNLLGEDSGNEVDIDIDVSVRLEKLFVEIGSSQASEQQELPFALGFSTLLNFASVIDFPFEFELTHEQLSFGLTELSIPIAIPQLPLSLNDLNLLKGADGRWDIQTNWLANLLPELEAQIGAQETSLENAKALLVDLQAAPDENQAAIFQQQYRIIPGIRKVLFDLVGRKFLYEAILYVYQAIGQNSRAQYQQYVELYQATIDSALGWIALDTQLSFDIADAMFVLPFNNPSDIRVEGSASIGGVDPTSVFAPLADLQLTLGVSADAIYFAVQGGADPIQLPDFGRYPGNAVNLDKLIIGYGYSKNSLKIDFAGELILSEQLIDDADSSAEFGVGVRLPNNSKLRFKLDLIPITLGEVDFLLPLVDVDIDLRSDLPPPAPALDGQCTPAWDGLQLIVPDVIRADLKKFRYSLFFGPVPAANGEYAFDLDIGNDTLGIRHICDYQFISPIAGVLPIPFLMDTSPFFNRLCTNIRLGGFGLSFDLVRPFPHPSPLLIFELLGFIADPDSPVDPNGHIANLMYAELFHARITLPAPVVAMFPGLGNVVNTDYSGRINVATVIAIGQRLQQWWSYLQANIEDNGQRALQWVERIVAQPPEVEVTGLLALLPLEMRMVQLQGKLVHFDADATFILALASDVQAQYGESETPVEPSLEQIYYNDFSSPGLDKWQAYDFGLKRGKGEWSIDAGQLIQKNNVGDNSPARYGAVLVSSEFELENGQILIKGLSFDDDGMGVVFHLQAKDTYYRFRMTSEQKQWRLDKILGGDITALQHSEDVFEQGKIYQIKIECRSFDMRNVAKRLTHFGGTGVTGTDRRTRPVPREIKKPVPQKATRIKIWVNGQLWCSVEDDDKPLLKGRVGLDSWWNKGLRFDDLLVYAYQTADLSIENEVREDQLVALDSRLNQNNDTLSDVLSGFSPEDIAIAMQQGSEYSLAMRAQVRITENVRLDMLGSIDGAGHFSLASSVNLSPFDLKIADLSVPIPLQITSRLQLTGQSAGVNSFAQLSGEFFAAWNALPGPSEEATVATLLLGSESDPVSFVMSSERQFRLQGHGELQLFANQISISGELDISQSHVMMSGDMLFQPVFQVANRKVMSITAAVKAHFRPGNELSLSGSGELQLFEKAFIASDMLLSNDKLSLRLTSAISRRSSSWTIGDFPIQNVYLALQGSIDFAHSQPILAVSGEASFELLDATIRGRMKIETQADNWLLAAEGKLFWQGRNWLDGSMQLTQGGLQIEGRGDFALPLTATQLGGGLQIAGLYLNLVVSGRFNLNSQGQLLAWGLDLDWQLAIKLPGATGDHQSLPVAMQQLHINGSHDATQVGFKLAHLVDFSGFTLFDFDGVTVPIPIPDFSQPENFYLNTQTVSFPAPEVTLPVVTLQATNSQGDDNEPVPLTPLFIEQQRFSGPDVEVEVPSISTSANASPLFSLPTFTTQQVPIGKFALEDQFRLALGWQDNQLGVMVKVGQNEEFHGFEGLVQQLIGTIGVTFPGAN